MFTPGAHDYASLAPLCMHAACRLSMHSGGCEWCAQPTQGVTVGFGVCPTAKHTTCLLLQCWMCSHMWVHICRAALTIATKLLQPFSPQQARCRPHRQRRLLSRQQSCTTAPAGGGHQSEHGYGCHWAGLPLRCVISYAVCCCGDTRGQTPGAASAIPTECSRRCRTAKDVGQNCSRGQTSSDQQSPRGPSQACGGAAAGSLPR